ncbi:MAG TPA: hypothetical protein VM487_21910 [Phycisphaerae bacterium]|nr:hypothetical protein [Phycisphaerae bacterium]
MSVTVAKLPEVLGTQAFETFTIHVGDGRSESVEFTLGTRIEFAPRVKRGEANLIGSDVTVGPPNPLAPPDGSVPLTPPNA